MTNTKHECEAVDQFLAGMANDVAEGKPVQVINCHGQKSWFKAALLGLAVSAAAMTAAPAHAGILSSLTHSGTAGAEKMMQHVYEATGAVGSMQGASSALRYANGNPGSIAAGVAEGIGAAVHGGEAILGFFSGKSKHPEHRQGTYQEQPRQVQPQVESGPASSHDGEVVRQVDGPWHDVGPH